MKRFFVLLLKGAVSLSLLVALFRMTDVDRLFTLFSEAHFPLILTAGVLYLSSQYLSACRWQTLLRAQEVFAPVHRLFSFYLIGMFFNNFLPSSLGGDTVRGYSLYRFSGHGRAAVVTVFLDRYIGLVALVAIGFIAWILGYSYFPDRMTAFVMTGMTALLVVGSLMMTSRSVERVFLNVIRKGGFAKSADFLSGLYELLIRYRDHKRLVLNAVWISFAIQLSNIVVYIILAEALRISIPWGYFFLFFPMVTVAAMLPISFNGVGVREGVMVYLFNKAGISSAQALGLSLTWFFVVTGISLLGGVLFVLQRKSG